ncbi:pentatricopeptide repeat-containing protein At2g39620 isoform X2 [Silene latifolia]|uniref:pentatricopeptide repeat-containing protein At2g39620 isoform X2 n=1 Tax=Silene latifolia TaxID=37657 RepID=UPI003D7739C3
MKIQHILHRSVHSLVTPTSKFPTLHSKIPTDYRHYISLFPSCKDLNAIFRIHARLLVLGIAHYNSTLSQLINAYSLHRRCDLSRLVFDSAKNPGVILYNSMIRAYTRSQNHDSALQLYNTMLENKLEPDNYTYTFVLKACADKLDYQLGVHVHNDVISRGLEMDVYIGTSLVDMYCKMGRLDSAVEVFDKMPKRDIVSWNAIIGGLSKDVNFCAALMLFRKMQIGDKGIVPNSVSLLNVFPALCNVEDVQLCKSVHGFVIRRVFPSEVYNGLIDVYAKCGLIEYARSVFDGIRDKDDVSWGTIMAGYVYNEYFYQVLELFDSMKGKNGIMNKVSVVSSSTAASELRDLERGKEIHEYAIQHHIDSDCKVATSLMSMYLKCGELGRANQLFRGLKEKDLVAWSAFIAALVQGGFPKEAMALFGEMLHRKLKPNTITLLSVFPACAELSLHKFGKSIHCYCLKAVMDSEVATGNALASMYAKWGFSHQALTVFHRIQYKNVVSWNSLINGYAQSGKTQQVIEMFHELLLSGMKPDSETMVGVLPACALSHHLDQGMCVHGLIIKCGFVSDCHIRNALIDMYAKCGKLSFSETLFNEINFTKDEVSWNTIITGYVQNSCFKEAMCAFHHMISEGLRPSAISIVSVLPAVSHLTCLPQERYFEEMENRDTVTWNTMLAGYAIHGHTERVIALFSHMQKANVILDSVTFLSILSACRHGGLVEEGKEIFNSMCVDFHLEPKLEHYACMVDLLGRSGLFSEILDLIDKMPMEPDAAIWGALLGACRMHSNSELAEMALNNLVKLEPANPAHYVGLSNIYAQSGKWIEAKTTRLKLTDTGLKKIPGHSWI